MKKGEIYTFAGIEKFANEKGYEINSLGANVIGESFLVLRKEDRDMTISFVLTGNTSNGFNYECIYSDL
jgi:hypothetical protein